MEKGILSDEQIEQVNSRYSHLNDEDIIEELAYMDLLNGEKRIVITGDSIEPELLHLSKEINDINSIFQKIQVMYELFISDVLSFFNQKKILEKSKKLDSSADVNRYMLHLLSSGKLFVDFNENQIVHTYSKDSLEYATVKSFASNQFDNSFAYRFCCYLRNFSQHIGLPISDVAGRETELDAVSVDFFIDLNYLLNSSFHWKKLKIELECIRENNVKINAIEIVEEYMSSIIELYYNYNEFFLEKYHHRLQEIKLTLKNIPLKPYRYFASRITKYDMKYHPERRTLSPISAYAEINEIYRKLNKIGLVKISNEIVE